MHQLHRDSGSESSGSDLPAPVGVMCQKYQEYQECQECQKYQEYQECQMDQEFWAKESGRVIIRKSNLQSVNVD